VVLEHFLFFHNIGNSNPNWLSYFWEGLKPPTRKLLLQYRFVWKLGTPKSIAPLVAHDPYFNGSLALWGHHFQTHPYIYVYISICLHNLYIYVCISHNHAKSSKNGGKLSHLTQIRLTFCDTSRCDRGIFKSLGFWIWKSIDLILYQAQKDGHVSFY
jgi:hypothetical protein